MFKTGLIGFALFLMVGIPAAYQILDVIGAASNYFAIISIALMLSVLLSRNIVFLFLVVLLTLCINLPSEVLLGYGFDKIVLIGVLVGMVSFPSVHKMLNE